MCTSIAVNKKKTIIGWNLDLLDMEHRVRPTPDGVYIEIRDAKEGWMPLFGANARGDFVGMPTCWPYDARSDPAAGSENVILLDIDLLLQKKTLREVRELAERRPVRSEPGVTFMAALSDAAGNILHIVPGQGCRYYERPDYAILTNFSPFKGDSEKHPWMGLDRYQKAEAMLREASENFDVADCFAVLRAVAQTVCPTVVSMVFDVRERTVYWCEDRNWDNIRTVKLERSPRMKDFIAYCGLDCETCEARIATVNGDDALREKVAKLWSELNGAEITPEMINCAGCSVEGVKTPYCDKLCPIRQCALSRRVETCGSCSEMETCEKVGMILGNNAEARRNLAEAQ